MGKVSINTLVPCRNQISKNDFIKNVCNNLKTNQIEVGIKSKNSSIDTMKTFSSNEFCNGHLNYQTCLLKYQSQINKTFLIIIQPLPIEFDRIYGLINSLDPSNKEFVQSESNQKWANELVFKIKEIHSEIAYQVYIK